jgi:hypothetical protein
MLESRTSTTKSLEDGAHDLFHVALSAFLQLQSSTHLEVQRLEQMAKFELRAAVGNVLNETCM